MRHPLPMETMSVKKLFAKTSRGWSQMTDAFRNLSVLKSDVRMKHDNGAFKRIQI